MSVLEILKWPDARLCTVAAEVTGIDAAIRQLAADMLETMYAAPGRGLAGPQVGAMQRIFVMDAGWKTGAPTPMVCINPVLSPLDSGSVETEEGCLSIPGVTAPVRRPDRVRMVWTDLDGGRQERDLDGFEALCAQHETDHLDGIVTLDRVDAATRARVLQAYEAALA